jgi:hypothetical protein
LNSQKPEDGFFFVSAVATGIDSDCRKFASFAPTFDCKRGDSKYFGNFTNSKEIREGVYGEFLIVHMKL